jgi:hypothetical protein
MKKQIWLYWWTTISAMHTGSFVRTTYSSRRLSAKQVTQHDRENGWPVSKVKRMKVDYPGEPLKAPSLKPSHPNSPANRIKDFKQGIW